MCVLFLVCAALSTVARSDTNTTAIAPVAPPSESGIERGLLRLAAAIRQLAAVMGRSSPKRTKRKPCCEYRFLIHSSYYRRLSYMHNLGRTSGIKSNNERIMYTRDQLLFEQKDIEER